MHQANHDPRVCNVCLWLVQFHGFEPGTDAEKPDHDARKSCRRIYATHAERTVASGQVENESAAAK